MPLKTAGKFNSEKALIIFDFFEIDKTLPKHVALEAKRAKEAKRGPYRGSTKSMAVVSGNLEDFDQESEDAEDSGHVWFNVRKEGPRKKASLWGKLFGIFHKEVTIHEVFTRIKANAEELQEWNKRDKDFQDMLARARASSQQTLVKRLEKEAKIRAFENILHVKGQRKYISESQLLEFVAKCERGLCLDWITYFVRPIPADVVAAKAKCDEDHVFDNYVILHYDPDSKATTKEDRAAQALRRQDPILFGVVQGSRKLYFVGDWVDEHCDLTFEEIVKSLGRGPLTIADDVTDHAIGV
jgi:hypothetical protein